MKVSTEIDNNFGYEKITQLVDNIPLNISWTLSKSFAENLNILRVFLRLMGLSSEHRITPSVILFGPSEWFPRTILEGYMVLSIFIIKFYNFPHIPLTVIYCCNTCICSILPYKLSLTSKFTSCWIILSLTVRGVASLFNSASNQTWKEGGGARILLLTRCKMVHSDVFSWVTWIHKQHIDFMILLDRIYLELPKI